MPASVGSGLLFEFCPEGVPARFMQFVSGDVLALPSNLQFGEWLGLAIVTALAAWLYATGSRRA